MLFLDTSTTLQVVCSVAVTANQLEYTSSAIDLTGHSPVFRNGTFTNSDVDAVQAPASGLRTIKSLSIYNKDTVSATVTVKTDASGTERIVWKGTLLTGEALYYEDGEGFYVVDATGARKSLVSTGRFISTTVVTQGTTSVTPPTGATSFFARGRAGGGGGGGVSSSAANGAAAGGGSQGGYFEHAAACVGGVALTCAVGNVGAAGANTGGTGGTGGDTTLTANGVTVTAKGGLGGVGQTFGTTNAVTLGGAAPAISTNGNVANETGEPGDNGIRFTGLIAGSGAGGGMGGGAGKNTAAAGNNATGTDGAGGGGANNINGGGAAVGGTGAKGLLKIDWFT